MSYINESNFLFHSRWLRTFCWAPILWTTSLASPTCANAEGTTEPLGGDTQFAIYALSRGRGVPAPTAQALEVLHDQFDKDRDKGIVTRIESTQIGLEGETRLCVEFSSPEAASNAWEYTRQKTLGIELLNLRRETCIKK